MRILSTTLCLEKAGSHVLALSLASAMAELGHEMVLFNQGEQLVDTGMVRQYLSAKVLMVGMDQYPLFNKLCWKVNALFSRLGIRVAFHEKCKTLLLLFTVLRHRIQLVHGHEVLVQNSRLVTLCRWLSVPVVITDHGGYSMLVKMGDWSFAPFANLAKAVIAVSENAARLLHGTERVAHPEELRQLGARILAADFRAESENMQQARAGTSIPLTVPIVTIHNGVQNAPYDVIDRDARRANLGIVSGSLVFGMIGRGTEQKGWRYAVTAFLRLKELEPTHPLILLCLGDGSVLQELRQQLSHLHPDIVFVGNVDDPHQYMPLCDVGLMPSCFSEGLPLSIIEFYEHNIPVIASELGGIPEIITPVGEAPGCQLIAMEANASPQVASLVQAMRTYVLSTGLRAEHSRGARQIRAKFDMRTCAVAYKFFFQQVLA